jgi:hypothetical protein
MRNTLLILAFLATSSALVPVCAATAVMTNHTIQAMLSGGVPVPTIIRAIKTAKQIDLYMNADEYARLKNAGASKSDADQIIQAIHSREYDGIDNSPAEPAIKVPVVAIAPVPASASVVAPVAVASVAPVVVPVALPVATLLPVASVPVVPVTTPAAPATAALVPVPASKPATASTVPPGSKIFVEPNNGFESYIVAALVKKHVPIKITANKSEADFILRNTVTEKPETSGLGKLARCAFSYCIGIDGTQTATVELLDAKQQIVWAYNVRKPGSSNFQSSAEAIAKHMKEVTR